MPNFSKGEHVYLEDERVGGTVVYLPGEKTEFYQVKRDDGITGSGEFVPGYGFLWKASEREVRKMPQIPHGKAFKKGKNADQLGIDKTRKFVLLEKRYGIEKGEILTLLRDDGSPWPWFVTEKGKHAAIFWHLLAYADLAQGQTGMKISEAKGRLKIGDIVRTNGDGKMSTSEMFTGKVVGIGSIKGFWSTFEGFAVQRDDGKMGAASDFGHAWVVSWENPGQIEIIKSQNAIMKTFEANKTMGDLRIDKSQRFVLVNGKNEDGEDYDFKVGDVLVLADDDDTFNPEFRRVSDGHCDYVDLKDLAYEDQDMVDFPRGHEIQAGIGSKLLVLEAIGTIRFIGSKQADGGTKQHFTMSVSELRRNGYKDLDEVEPAVEVTMAEVEAKFGKKVKIKGVEKA